MAHPAEHGSEHEDDREDDRDRDERGSEESANQCFEYGGEREEHAEASKKPERDEQGKQGGQAAGEDVAHTDTNKDDGDEETTRSVPLDSSSSQCVAQDAAPEFSTPSGRVAQLSAESPRAENVQDARAAAAAPSQQQHGPEAKEDGERHERIQVPAAGSNTETTSSRTVGSSDIVPLSVTVPRLAATGTPNVEAGIQLAPGYIRRPSYMPGPAMRPARSAARASIQLSLPPLTVLGLEAESTCAASNDNAIRIAQAAAEAEPEEPGTAEGQSWAEYHSLNAGRQHSTSNLVAVRRNLRQLSVELFEEGDSDDSSSSSRSSGASDEEDASVDEPSNEVDNHVSWQLSEEGKSRMAQLTKATVAKESPAVKMSRKYLKLFAPSNSVRLYSSYRAACFLLLYNSRRAIKVLCRNPILVRTAAVRAAVGSTTSAEHALTENRVARRRLEANAAQTVRNRCAPPLKSSAVAYIHTRSTGTNLHRHHLFVGFSAACCTQGSRHLQSAGDRAPENERDRVAAKGGLGLVPCSPVSGGAGFR